MKRVILGVRGSDYGLWISKPGKDAASTSDDDMLVSPMRFLVQPYLQGRIYSTGANVSTVITHNLGYIPVIEVFGTFDNGQITLVSGVTTTKLLANNQNTNNGYPIDLTYVIFRTQLAAS